ncbi:MAG: phosphorylase family protein [Thermoguttaceae bacterium]
MVQPCFTAMVLRYVLRQWLGVLAQRTVRETVMNAARESMQQTAEAAQQQAEDPSLQRCDIGVVFALGIEAGGLEDRLSDVMTIRSPGIAVRRGRLGSRSLALAQSGPGYEAAARATSALISAHDPSWIFSAGFAGGLNAKLRKHDILMASEVAGPDGRRLLLDLKVDPAALAASPGVHVGTLLSTDHIVRLPDEKRQLGERHEALAVDMETIAVAEICRREKVPLIAVRIISDAVDDALPGDIGRLIRQKTIVRKAGAVVGAVMNRPGSVKDMLQLKEDALLASDKLARFLESMIRQLAPALPRK